MYCIHINNITWNFFKFPFKPDGNDLNRNVLHIHSHAELFFCFEGSIQLNFPNEKITINKNDACLIPAGVNHTKTQDNSSNAIWCSIGLFCNEGADTINNNKNSDSRIISMLYSNKVLLFQNNTDLHTIFQKIISNEVIDTATLLELVCIFYKASTLNITEKISVSRKNSKKDIERLLILDHIINTEYVKCPSMKEIADRLYLTTRQLSRVVLANFGTSLHKLFIKKRLFCAATQLVETNSSIETISHLVGFSNKNFFYHHFKNEFGMTPARYRTENQNIVPR